MNDDPKKNIIIAINRPNNTDIVNADLNQAFALWISFAHKFCATNVASANDKFMIGIIARVSTLDAAVNPAITLLPKPFITACTANAHTATNEWFNIAGIAIFVISFSSFRSKIWSNLSVSNFFNLRSNTTTANVVAMIRDTTVAHAAHAIHRWNLITNSKSKQIFAMAEIIKNCNGVLESHNALNVEVAIS